jgi:16S rRNA A1518/A1519 N6-dimethyltransferase RsmA/KsgA/DIM1 with predicted DNA glycosylase/AP lyase activity
VSERRAQSARRSRRARSQHFLRSQALAAALVDDAGIRRDHLVLDLGAGGGRLTAELARTARHVVAVELDPHWAARLRGRWGNVDVVEGDAAAVELPREPFRVVANLPFAHTTTILRHLLDDPRVPLVRADLVLEWGVAVKRALPWPSTLNGILWSSWYTARLARRLPRGAFVPAPAVDAGVLVLERRTRALVPEALAASYRRFVGGGFRRGVRSVAPRQALRSLALVSAAPRDLDAYQWAELFLAMQRGASSWPSEPRRRTRI